MLPTPVSCYYAGWEARAQVLRSLSAMQETQVEFPVGIWGGNQHVGAWPLLSKEIQIKINKPTWNDRGQGLWVEECDVIAERVQLLLRVMTKSCIRKGVTAGPHHVTVLNTSALDTEKCLT